MTAPASFQRLLDEARLTHRTIAALRDFAEFPDDLADTTMEKYLVPSAGLMASDKALAKAVTTPFAQAALDAGADAHWRETYKGTDIGADFMARFGSYALIGPNAPWISRTMAGFIVYMPTHLCYPRHEHPAEELYFILAGSAEFSADGSAPKFVRAGGAVFHHSGVPHATATHNEPLLAYVIWRNNLDTPPVLSARTPD